VIPVITKFNSNSVLFDSIGSATNVYLSMAYDKRYTYFLTSTNGTTIKYDTISEQYSTLSAIKVTSDSVYSIIPYAGDVYGFAGYDVKKFVNDTVLYIRNNTELVQESFDRKLKVVHLSSASGIRDFFIDEDYNYYVIHAKNKISKFSKERILKYSFQMNPTSTSVFADLAILPNNAIEIIKMDFVREYTGDGLKSYPIFLGKTQGNDLFLAKFDETLQEVTYAALLGLSGVYYDYGDTRKLNYNLTNYEYLKNQYTENNQIVFKVVLQNVFDNQDIIDVEIPVSTDKFTSESHHFSFSMDGINGAISLYCDSKLVSSVEIPPAQYIFQDIFSETLTVGNTYFHNNQTLPKYLKQPLYYHVNNAAIQQFKLYNKALNASEIQFHTLNNLKMDDLVVSMPCGQRSEIDSIERQFKLDVSGNKSNSINLIIKNSQITNVTLQNQLKDVISERLKKVIPVTTNINNIEFR
jgi:hypothetical protein